MAKKIIIREQKKGGCASLIGALLIVCLAIYAFAFALIAAVGVGAWFLMRAWWRSLVANKPDSRIVEFGSKMTPMGRKVLAGVISAVVVIAMCAGVSSCSSANKAKDAGARTTAAATKSEDEEKSGNETTNTMTTTATETPSERVDDFVNAFNAASATPFVQDTTFDPSDKAAPYRPRRYNSPAYSGGSGVHGTCGDFSVTIIGCRGSTEVSATRTDTDFQAIADFARATIAAAKPDADQTAVDTAIDELANGNPSAFNSAALNIDSSFNVYATGAEFFLRFK